MLFDRLKPDTETGTIALHIRWFTPMPTRRSDYTAHKSSKPVVKRA